MKDYNKMLEKNKKIKKVLFYTHTPRDFRNTLIGYFYEISQIYPTILLSEELDIKTEKAIKNKKLFPKLEKIIPISQYTGLKMNIFSKNKYLCKFAKEIIEKYKPDIVISATDMCIFDLYLMRFAKEKKSVNIIIQSSMTAEMKQVRLIIDLLNLYLRTPFFLPYLIRYFIIKFRKYLGHFLYYWILPLTSRQLPFIGKSSYILKKGKCGMRDSDYCIVFTKRDYNIYLKDGTAFEKLYILSHPLARSRTREFFKKTLLSSVKNNRIGDKIVTLMLPSEEIGFKRNDYSLISKERKFKITIEIIKLIIEILKGWRIFIKPHPNINNFKGVRKIFESISDIITVVEPSEPAEKYIEAGDVIIGLPRSASMTLFTASLQCIQKPIISLDFHPELLGDVYKDFEGIEYIDNKRKFIEILKLIRDDVYQKPQKKQLISLELKEKEFSDALEMIEYLFHQKKCSHL